MLPLLLLSTGVASAVADSVYMAIEVCTLGVLDPAELGDLCGPYYDARFLLELNDFGSARYCSRGNQEIGLTWTYRRGTFEVDFQTSYGDRYVGRHIGGGVLGGARLSALHDDPVHDNLGVWDGQIVDRSVWLAEGC